MGIRIRYGWLWITVVVALSSAPAEAQLSQFWSAEVIDRSTDVRDLNNLNQALFSNYIWNIDDGTTTSLDAFGGETQAIDINNLGHVVGWSQLATGTYVSFLWDPENGMRDLSVLAGVPFSPIAINDHGQIVGSTLTSEGDPTNGFWDPVTGVMDLFGAFQPIALNNNGQVVGDSYREDDSDPFGLRHMDAFIWDRVNGVRNLGPGIPKAINDNGEVAGWIPGWADGPDYPAGFVWDAVNGYRKFLPTNMAYDSVDSVAGITADGYVFGTLSQIDLGKHLFIYKTKVIDLHPVDPSVIWTGAIAVNDAHVILGVSQLRPSVRSYELTIFRPEDGALPGRPIMPVAGVAGEWIFYEAPSGAWFDPPTAPGFDYEMLSGSLFTSVLDFPTGFNGPFTVVTDGCEIPGSFVPGDSVDFVALCGRGVSAFGVRGIDPARDPSAPHFPLRLAFGTPIADFRMRAFIEGGTADTAPPILSAIRTAANEHGWNNGEVVVTFSCTDAESPIDIAPVSPVTVDTEGAGQSVSATCQDAAGNQSSLTIDHINIDRTAPVIAAARSPEPNAFGWNNSDVTATFSCVDGLSGVEADTTTPPILLASEGAGQSASGSCRDKAGNEAVASVYGVNIDKTAPVLVCSTNTESLWPPNHKLMPITVAVDVVDGESGPAGWTLLGVASDEDAGDSMDIEGWLAGTADSSGFLRAERSGGGDGRQYTLRYQGPDRAGNTALCSATVEVPRDRRR